MLFTDPINALAKDPAVIAFGGKYYLYYSAFPTEEYQGKGLRIGIAVSCDLEHFETVDYFYGSEPYDQTGVAAPAAFVRGDTVHLFYQSYGHTKMEEDCICHATSKDGIHFTKDATNPIFAPSKSWCCGRAIDADVCEFQGRLFLYIATRDHAFEIQKIGGAWADIDSDYSRDTWTEIAPQALLTPEFVWEGKCIEAAATLVHDGRMFLFYGGAYNCSPQQIGYAYSDDGSAFFKGATEPVLPCGKVGTWNASESGHPYAFCDTDGSAYLFYQGSPDAGKHWYLSKAKIEFDAQNHPTVIPDSVAWEKE